MKKTKLQQAIDGWIASDPAHTAAFAITVTHCGGKNHCAHLGSSGPSETIITALAKFIASDPDISLLVREALCRSILYLKLPAPGTASS